MFCISKLVNRLLIPQSSSTGASSSFVRISTTCTQHKEFTGGFSQSQQPRNLGVNLGVSDHQNWIEEVSIVETIVGRGGRAFFHTENHHKMSYFVIGVSGVTCGGKTTMSKLLQRSFPWSRIIHQDKYFYPEDYPGHLRLPEIQNHINFDRWNAMDMDQMHKDVEKLLWTPPRTNENNQIIGNGEIAPNFAEGLELLRNLKDIELNTSKYSNIPILIIEGFIMFESEDFYDKCDIRFFLTLDEETCRRRRNLRVFDPPDGPGYFDHCIWPEYQKHYKHFIEDRAGINVVSGRNHIADIWKDSVELIMQKMDEKFAYKLNSAANENLQ